MQSRRWADFGVEDEQDAILPGWDYVLELIAQIPHADAYHPSAIFVASKLRQQRHFTISRFLPRERRLAGRCICGVVLGFGAEVNARRSYGKQAEPFDSQSK